jgi:hypothetical protein
VGVAYPTLNALDIAPLGTRPAGRKAANGKTGSPKIQQIQALSAIKNAAAATWRPKIAIPKLAIASNRTYNRD